MYMHTYTQTNIYIYTHIYTCTYTRIHAQTYTYACICSPMHRLKISVSTPQRVKQYHRRICVCIYICMHMHIYMHIHCGTTCSECVRRCVCWCHKNTCVTYTPAHALVPKTPVLKCTQHSLQKIAHIYIYTHTHAHAYICKRTHARIYDTAQHAETLTPRLTTYAQICIHIHIHMYIHACKYIYTCTCICIHTCTSVHIHTYTHIRTHTTCTYAHTQARLEWKRCSDCARSWCRRRKLYTPPSFNAINNFWQLQS